MSAGARSLILGLPHPRRPVALQTKRSSPVSAVSVTPDCRQQRIPLLRTGTARGSRGTQARALYDFFRKGIHFCPTFSRSRAASLV